MSVVEESPAKRKPRILVVDDDADFLRICKLTLENAGYDVSVAEGGLESLDAIRDQGRPDLVLMDFMMPGLNGMQALKLLEDFVLRNTVPVVFVSAVSDRKIVTQALMKGARDYLMKPFSPDELLQTVQTHLKSAR